MTQDPIIAIIGAGPAACTLAALLAAAGLRPLIFDDGRRPDLLVGESLIPAVVPLLRRLGIEPRVAAISQHKPGVSFLHDDAEAIHFDFKPVEPLLPSYAYNVDRAKFDLLLRDRAVELGAAIVRHRAKVLKAPEGSGAELMLAEESLAAAGLTAQPDFIVDATGRARMAARLLDIGADRGPRNDVALFAHFADFTMPEPAGQVLISRLTHGWSWRIPLPDRMSCGVVLDREAASHSGSTPEERLENILRREPMLRDAAANARRISPVAVYNNYQLTSHRSFGLGWAAVGDAFGFVDPMLSSGLFLAMESARALTDALTKNGRSVLHDPAALLTGLRSTDALMRQWYARWTQLVSYFYDGRIYSLHEAGAQMRQAHPNPVQRSMDRMVSRNIARMTAGATTRSAKSQWLLKLSSRFLAWGVPPPEALAIR